MTQVLAFVVCLFTADAESHFPTERGVSWTFRETHGKRTTEFTLRSSAPGKEKLSAFSEGDKDLRTDGNVTVIKRDGKIRWIVRTTKDEVQFFRDAWGFTFLQDFAFKKDLKPGMKWTSAREFMSCGIGSFDVTYQTSSETITVPAGTFTSIRVDLGDRRRGGESLWFAPGVGLVQWKQGDRVQQLVKMKTNQK